VTFQPPPPTAAWRHEEARSGFEVVWFQRLPTGWGVDGHAAAVEGGQTWAVEYAIELDAQWRTRWARIGGRAGTGAREVELEADGEGHWLVDGTPAPHLDGCLDVDLEASAMTNAFPVHRLGLAVGADASAPAVYVRALDLAVERLEQDYTRVPTDTPGHAYDYAAPAFTFSARLTYDPSGLVLTYPGLATRAA
jgi:uncharacterized protein